jgi:hypothetical protein
MLVKNRRIPHWFGKQALVISERKSDGVDYLDVMTSSSRDRSSIILRAFNTFPARGRHECLRGKPGQRLHHAG